MGVVRGRVEELAPFPFNLVRDVADEYPNAEVIWCQEEPLNQVRESTPLRAKSLQENGAAVLCESAFIDMPWILMH